MRRLMTVTSARRAALFVRRRASSSLSNASSTNSSSVLQSSRSLRAFANASSPIFSHAAIAEVEKEEHVRWINNDWNAPAASTSSKILSFKRQEEEEEEEEEEEDKIGKSEPSSKAATSKIATERHETSERKTRSESDLLGELDTIPKDALYGIATQRALENYPITGVKLSHFPEFIRALAFVKKAAATANFKIGLISLEIFKAISTACDNLLESKEHHRDFIVLELLTKNHPFIKLICHFTFRIIC